MISAFKRLVHTNNGQTPGDKTDDKKRLSSGNYQPMDQSLQKKFSKGVHYNMKIIIRGDKNVGKTSLFLRLQGESFKEEYVPTDEIQVANIEWNYNVTDDKVKVEIWEVVDKGKKRKAPTDLKLKLNEKKNGNKSIQEPEDDQPVLDAEFIDVYKNTNGVILVFDITKQWSFEYVQREIDNIPKNIPILIIGNHRDQGHHGLPINEDKVKSFIETIERESSGQIRYAETSMRNGFGLKYIYKFFNLPFLHLKKQSLLKQLQVNDREIDACNQELTIIEESDDQNYERFLYTIQNRRRENADRLSQIPKSTKPESNLTSKSIPFNLAGTSNNNMNVKEIMKPTPSIIIGANNPLPKSYSNNVITKNTSNSRMSSNGVGGSRDDSSKKQPNIENESEEQAKLRQFLEDAIEVREEMNRQQQNQVEESDDEDELEQPKILSYQDELDEEDQIEGQPSSILESNYESLSKNDDTKQEDKELETELDEKLNLDKSSHNHSHHNSHKSIKKETKSIINLVDELPDKSILDKDKSTKEKTKKKKSKKSSKESGSSKRKEKKIEDLLGPCVVAPLDEGPTSNDDYLSL